MNKITLGSFLIAATITLVGCGKPPAEWVVSGVSLKEVKGLEDCEYNIVDTGDRRLTVIRCPASSTTTIFPCGKAACQSTVVDENTKQSPTSIVGLQSNREKIIQVEKALQQDQEKLNALKIEYDKEVSKLQKFGGS